MNRADAGRAAKASGDAFEDWLNTQHEKARHLGILAHIEKTQAVAKMVHGRLMYTEKGVADYVGCLESGRYLALEAKSTKEARFAKNNVSSKQQDHLERVARAGGLALLLVEFRPDRFRDGFPGPSFGQSREDCFAVPWLEAPWEVKRTAESISANNIRAWQVEPECYLKRWHAGGVPSTVVKMCHYARE